jgi:hypothetical protein
MRFCGRSIGIKKSTVSLSFVYLKRKDCNEKS